MHAHYDMVGHEHMLELHPLNLCLLLKIYPEVSGNKFIYVTHVVSSLLLEEQI